MSFSALDSDLTGPLFASAGMRAVFSDRARIAAMLRMELALARAEAAHGLAPRALADALKRIRPEELNLRALGRKTADAGTPTIPFVKAVEAKLPEKLRERFHFGATSQDIADTALVLQMAEAFDLIADDLTAIVGGLSKLARTNRKTPCIGRTYGQHAAPVTFGYIAALWLAGIADAAADLPRLRQRVLVTSLGGPVGTLTALGAEAPTVTASFAKELGLSTAAVPWHVLRARMVETGTWLATLIGALAKMATDVALLTSTEVGEVSEPHMPGRGGSTAMPHKRNPVSATVILAAQSAAKGHVVTLLDAMSAGNQRPVGAWHAEWHALPQLFGLASGALREARSLASGIILDRKRMRANLDLTRGLIFADAAVARLAPALGKDAARRVVEKAADSVRETGRPLKELLLADTAIPQATHADVARAFDLAPAIDAASRMVDRALVAAKATRTIKRNR
jgi:3-carboxy-cis,cis-muconate cycloisomerase